MDRDGRCPVVFEVRGSGRLDEDEELLLLTTTVPLDLLLFFSSFVLDFPSFLDGVGCTVESDDSAMYMLGDSEPLLDSLLDRPVFGRSFVGLLGATDVA